MGIFTLWAAAAVFLAQSGLALGDDRIEWVAGDQGSWDDPTSWNLGRVPTLNDEVIFDIDNTNSGVGVEVEVPTGSLFCTLAIVSGDVEFIMGTDAVFIAIRQDEGCVNHQHTVYIAGKDQVASLTVVGGILTDGLDSYGVEIFVGFGLRSAGTLILTGDIQTEPWSHIQSDSLIRLGNTVDAPAQLVLDSDLDLRGFEIVGTAYSDSTEHGGVVRVSNGTHVQIDRIDSVRHVEVESGAVVELDRVISWNGHIQSDAVLISEHISILDLTLEERGEVRAFSLFGTVNMGESTGMISVEQISKYGLFRFDVSHLGVESEPLLMLSDLAHAGRVGVDIVVSSGEYPEIGAVLPLAVYVDFFGDHRRSAGVGDFERFSFELFSRQITEQIERRYFIANDEDGASLLVGPMWMNPADLNFDGVVDFFDVPVFMGLYLQGSPWANIDRVNGVERKDIELFISHVQAANP